VTIRFELRGESIVLHALLKAAGLAPSGGAAKSTIDSGAVRVDGVVETRRARQLRAGQRVRVGDAEVVLLPDPGGGAQVRT
jgi:ribosome-associated protein